MDSRGKLKDYYQGLFQSYGKDERSLGWTRQKQDVRFGELMKHVFMKKDQRQKRHCWIWDVDLLT